MASSTADTVAEYLASLPRDRKKAILQLRKLIRKNIPRAVKERMNWGMIAYEIPLKLYPQTYNGQPLLLVALASQKNHMALYLNCLYVDKKVEKQFRKDYKASGKKLDMGKSCLRFKKIEALALDVIEKQLASLSVKKFIAHYEAVHGPPTKV